MRRLSPARRSLPCHFHPRRTSPLSSRARTSALTPHRRAAVVVARHQRLAEHRHYAIARSPLDLRRASPVCLFTCLSSLSRPLSSTSVCGGPVAGMTSRTRRSCSARTPAGVVSRSQAHAPTWSRPYVDGRRYADAHMYCGLYRLRAVARAAPKASVVLPAIPIAPVRALCTAHGHAIHIKRPISSTISARAL